MNLTLVFILNLFMTLGIGFLVYWVIGKAKRIGQYEADLQYLPKLTREIEAIKNEFHRSTELLVGFKGEERKIIYEFSSTYSKAISVCLNIEDYIKNPYDGDDIHIGFRIFSKSLTDLKIVKIKFEIICGNDDLCETVNKLIESIFDHLEGIVQSYIAEMYGSAANRDIDTHRSARKKYLAEVLENYANIIPIEREYIVKSKEHLKAIVGS